MNEIQPARVSAAEVRQLEVDLSISPRTADYLVYRGVFSGGTRGRSSTYPFEAIKQREVYSRLPRMDIADLRHVMWWVERCTLGDFSRYRDQLLGVAQGQRDRMRTIARHFRRHPAEAFEMGSTVMAINRNSKHRALPLGMAHRVPIGEYDDAQADLITTLLGVIAGVPPSRDGPLAQFGYSLLPIASADDIDAAHALLTDPVGIWRSVMAGLERISEAEAARVREHVHEESEGMGLADEVLTELRDSVLMTALILGNVELRRSATPSRS